MRRRTSKAGNEGYLYLDLLIGLLILSMFVLTLFQGARLLGSGRKKAMEHFEQAMEDYETLLLENREE